MLVHVPAQVVSHRHPTFQNLPTSHIPSHLSRHARVAVSMAHSFPYHSTGVLRQHTPAHGSCPGCHSSSCLGSHPCSRPAHGHSERGFTGPGKSGPNGRDIRGGGGEEQAPMQAHQAAPTGVPRYRGRLVGRPVRILQVREDLRMPFEQGRSLIPFQVGTHDWRQPFQGWKEQRQDMTTSSGPHTF